MQDEQKSQMGEEKNRLEIQKLEIEISSIRRQGTRQLVTMISVLVGVVVSVVSILFALEEINHRNRQLAMEAQLRSHDIFMSGILDRMAMIKIRKFEAVCPKEKGGFREVSQERYATTTQQTAYVAAFTLAKRFKELRPVAEAALDEQSKYTGSAEATELLGELYRAQGKYSEAESLHKRFLEMREKTLGPDHPYVANSLNNLAAVYEAQGKYAEAEPLYKRALKIDEKALGPDHPDVATVCEAHWERR